MEKYLKQKTIKLGKKSFTVPVEVLIERRGIIEE